MYSKKQYSKLSKEEHNKMEMVENLVWEIAKILDPNNFIDPNKVKKAKNKVLEILSES